MSYIYRDDDASRSARGGPARYMDRCKRRHVARSPRKHIVTTRNLADLPASWNRGTHWRIENIPLIRAPRSSITKRYILRAEVLLTEHEA